MLQRNNSVTINDVAREAGVSKTTASFVLTERPGVHLSSGTRQRVRDAALRLGYRRSGLAAALSVGRIYTVGLLLQVTPESHTAATISPYSKDVIVALTCACARDGLRVTTILARAEGELTANELADGRVDGLVVASLFDEALARALYATGFPLVSIGSGYAERRIEIDNAGGARAAVEHLIGLGHRAIAYVTYSDRRVHSQSSQERRQGYEAALCAHGLTPRILEVEEAVSLLDRPAGERFSAGFCVSDYMADLLLREARARGLRVPHDLSLVGFDNGVYARLAYPALTTVDNPLDAQADAAIAALRSLWRGEPFTPPDPLPAHLVVRESTAAPYREETP